MRKPFDCEIRIFICFSCLLILFLAQSVESTDKNAFFWRRHAIDDSLIGADGVRLADVNGDGLPDIVTGWEQSGITRVYVNPGPHRAKESWPYANRPRILETCLGGPFDRSRRRVGLCP